MVLGISEENNRSLMLEMFGAFKMDKWLYNQIPYIYLSLLNNK